MAHSVSHIVAKIKNLPFVTTAQTLALSYPWGEERRKNYQPNCFLDVIVRRKAGSFKAKENSLPYWQRNYTINIKQFDKTWMVTFKTIKALEAFEGTSADMSTSFHN